MAFREKEFKEWFLNNIGGERQASSNLSLLRRIDDKYDIDKEFSYCCGKKLIEQFNYKKDEYESGIKPRHLIKIDGNEYTGTQSLKRALSYYKKFVTGYRRFEGPSCLPYGMDYDGINIRYEEGIPDYEKVEGLVDFLEQEYDKIIRFCSSKYSRDHDVSCDKIPVILSNKYPTKTYNNNDKILATMISKKQEEYQRPLNEEEIVKILKKKRMTLNVFGEYVNQSKFKYVTNDSSGPYIILYYLNTSAPSFEYYKSSIAGCLAHEYTHHYHFLLAPSNFYQKVRKPEIRSEVIESVADFSSFLYLLKTHNSFDCNLAVTEDKYRFWEDNFYTVLPYAKALYFFKVGSCELSYHTDFDYYVYEKAIDKLILVLRETQRSLYDAHDALTR